MHAELPTTYTWFEAMLVPLLLLLLLQVLLWQLVGLPRNGVVSPGGGGKCLQLLAAIGESRPGR